MRIGSSLQPFGPQPRCVEAFPGAGDDRSDVGVGQVEQRRDLLQPVAVAVVEDEDGAFSGREPLDHLAQAGVLAGTGRIAMCRAARARFRQADCVCSAVPSCECPARDVRPLAPATERP